MIPTPLWIVLFAIATVIFAFTLFFADSGEGAVTQAMLMGSVVFSMVTLLLLLHFLDNPYQKGVGSLRPVAMERTLRIADQELADRWLQPAFALRPIRSREVGAMTHDDVGTKGKPDLVEIFATMLLALAAVATAWSGYQANRWNGEQVKAGSRTNALRIDAARAQGLAETETQVDLATFIQWVDARAHDDARLQEFYETRFRAEFKPAFDAWIAMNPFTNPSAPSGAVQAARIPAGVQGRGGAPRRRRGRFGRGGAAQPPAVGELRPGSGPLRGDAVLRRHQRQAPHPTPPRRAARRRLGRLHRHSRVAGDLPGVDLSPSSTAASVTRL